MIEPMQIDWTSFALGAVAGLVLAFLFKPRDLKHLDLMLKRIGIELSVEGFEDKRTKDRFSSSNLE